MIAFRLFIGNLTHSLPTRKNLPTNSPLLTSIPIAALSQDCRLKDALHALHYQNHIVDSSTYVCLLQCCIRKKSLHHGKRIHALIFKRNQPTFTKDVFLHNILLQMYVKCGSLFDACCVFDGMVKRNVVSWNIMVAAYRKQGLSEVALALFHQMQRNGSGVQPDEFTFSTVLPACVSSASVEEGVDIHRMIIRSGFHLDVVVTNALIHMYAKFGNIKKARVLFDKMQRRDTVSWTAMITGYAHNGFHEEVLEVFEGMQRSGIAPNEFTFGNVLPAFVSSASLEQGVDIHRKIIRSGFYSNIVLTNVLIDMYANFGNIEKARLLFDKMQRRDTISWNVMIAGYAQNGFHEEALDVFEGMQRSSVQPDEFTFGSVLPACASSASLQEGVDIHGKIVRTGFYSNVVVTSALIDMYARFGNIQNVRVLFDKMQQRDTISWNVMITGYAQNGFNEEAVDVFEGMQRSGVAPNEFTFGSVLTACAGSASLQEGVDIHGKIVRSGFHSNVVVTSALIDMYAKFGNIQKARVLFDKMQQRDTLSWNVIIAGYAQNGFHKEALDVFKGMERSGVAPNEFTFGSVLTACAISASLQEGVDIHGKIVRSGFHSNVVVTSALIDMYSKFGNIHKARILFDEMLQRDTISWTAIITGYAQNGYGLEALKYFQKMQLTGFRPDSITFASILPVCATYAALNWGMDIHGQITRCGLLSHAIVMTALIDMYSKCGSIKKASILFDKMCNRQTISWNAMIAGYARNGCSMEAIKLFEQMEYLGVNPDDVTFVSVLSACSHSGLVKEGYQYFKSMNDDYHITPTMKHYICLIDLLGRAGHLNEAKDFINNMPIKPNPAVWTCLLGACRIHNNIELGEFAAEHLLELDPQNSVPYVLLSNIYAMSHRYCQIENIRKMMKDRGIRKLPGCSWIVVNNEVHAFFVGDRSHPKTQEIYGELERLSQVMKAVGYVPDTRLVLQDVKEEEKEQIL